MRFDFQKLSVYGKAKEFNSTVSHNIENSSVSRNKKDQLERAAFSIMLNIAEGSGPFTKPDKRNFYVIAKGSVFECVAIFDYLKEQNQLSHDDFNNYYNSLEEISKMLYSLIKGLS